MWTVSTTRTTKNGQVQHRNVSDNRQAAKHFKKKKEKKKGVGVFRKFHIFYQSQKDQAFFLAIRNF